MDGVKIVGIGQNLNRRRNRGNIGQIGHWPPPNIWAGEYEFLILLKRHKWEIDRR